MKKAFLILVLVSAFSFASPGGQTLIASPKHNIEFVSEDKSRSLSTNEILRKKVMLYLRYNMLLARVEAINIGIYSNTS